MRLGAKGNSPNGFFGQCTERTIYLVKQRQHATDTAYIDGEWNAEIRAALDALLAHPPDGAPVAVFDWDNTCIYNDIGEASFFAFVDALAYRFDLDAFWDVIPSELDRDGLRREFDALGGVMTPDFRARFGHLYEAALDLLGHLDAYRWLAEIQVGLTAAEVAARTEAVIAESLATPIGKETWSAADGVSVELQRGIRLFRPIADLFAALESAGIEVWVVTASPRWNVVSFAAMNGVPQERVIGIVNVEKDGVFANEIVPPITYRQGKVDAIRQFIGKTPSLVVGDTYTDFEMLDFAHENGGMAILLDRGDADVRRHAESRGWRVQVRWG